MGETGAAALGRRYPMAASTHGSQRPPDFDAIICATNHSGGGLPRQQLLQLADARLGGLTGAVGGLTGPLLVAGKFLGYLTGAVGRLTGLSLVAGEFFGGLAGQVSGLSGLSLVAGE